MTTGRFGVAKLAVGIRETHAGRAIDPTAALRAARTRELHFSVGVEAGDRPLGVDGHGLGALAAT